MHSVKAAAGRMKRITKKIFTLVTGSPGNPHNGHTNQSYWTEPQCHRPSNFRQPAAIARLV